MTRNSIVVSVALLLGPVLAGSTGCGKNLKPLTAEQKAEVKDTITATGRTANSARAADPSPTVVRMGALSQMNLPASANWLVGFVAGPNAASSKSSRSIPSDDTQKRMQKRLADANRSDCKIVTTEPAFTQNSSGKTSLNDLAQLKLDLKVSGASCPAVLDLSVSLEGSSTELNGKIAGQYKVQDAEYAKLNDITAFSIEGSFKAEGSETSGSAELEATGTLTSTLRGDVKFEASADVSGDQNGADGTVTLGFVFKDFEAEFKVKADGQELKYFLNDEETTKEEFNKYFDSLGFGGGASAGGSIDPDQLPPSGPTPTPTFTPAPLPSGCSFQEDGSVVCGGDLR